MSPILFFALQCAILAYALVSGVFLAFSDFIMRSLARTAGSGGVDAMQNINREVFRWVFMILFIGMAPVSLGIAAYGGFVVGGRAGSLFLASGLVYLIGCFAVTVFRNVPLNEALERMDTTSQQALDYWTKTYLPRWTFWNTVRTIASALSAALLLSGLLLMVQTLAPPA